MTRVATPAEIREQMAERAHAREWLRGHYEREVRFGGGDRHFEVAFGLLGELPDWAPAPYEAPGGGYPEGTVFCAARHLPSGCRSLVPIPESVYTDVPEEARSFAIQDAIDCIALTVVERPPPNGWRIP